MGTIALILSIAITNHFKITLSQCYPSRCHTPGYCYPCDSCLRGCFEQFCGAGGSYCSAFFYTEVLPVSYTYSDYKATTDCDPNSNSLNTWCAETTTDPNSYVELDFGEICEFMGVGSQGVKAELSFPQLYRVQYSRDGNTYNSYNYTLYHRWNGDHYNAEYSEYMNILSHPLYARYLRFIIMDFVGSTKALGPRAYGSCSDTTVPPTPSPTLTPSSTTASWYDDTTNTLWYNVKSVADITGTSELNVNTTYSYDANGNLVISVEFDVETDNHYMAFIDNNMNGDNELWSRIRYRQEFHGKVLYWSILGNTKYGLYSGTNTGLYEFDVTLGDTVIDNATWKGLWSGETYMDTPGLTNIDGRKPNWWDTKLDSNKMTYYNIYRGYIWVEQRRMLNEINAGVYVGANTQRKTAPGLSMRFTDIAVGYDTSTGSPRVSTIFEYIMDDKITNYPQWTTTSGVITDTFTNGADSNCPFGSDFCWKATDAFTLEHAIVDTVNYKDIALEYYMSSTSAQQDTCSIQYSSGTSVFSTVAELTTTSTGISGIFDSFNQTNYNLCIQLVGTAKGTAQTCYFNRLKLTGVVVDIIPTASEYPSETPSKQPTVSPNDISTLNPTGYPSETPTLDPTDDNSATEFIISFPSITGAIGLCICCAITCLLYGYYNKALKVTRTDQDNVVVGYDKNQDIIEKNAKENRDMNMTVEGSKFNNNDVDITEEGVADHHDMDVTDEGGKDNGYIKETQERNDNMIQETDGRLLALAPTINSDA